MWIWRERQNSCNCIIFCFTFCCVLQMSCQRISKRVDSKQTESDRVKTKTSLLHGFMRCSGEMKNNFSPRVLSLDNKLITLEYVHALLMCTRLCIWLSETALMCARIYYKHAAHPRVSERRSVGFFGARREARDWVIIRRPFDWNAVARHLDTFVSVYFGSSLSFSLLLVFFVTFKFMCALAGRSAALLIEFWSECLGSRAH